MVGLSQGMLSDELLYQRSAFFHKSVTKAEKVYS